MKNTIIALFFLLVLQFSTSSYTYARIKASNSHCIEYNTCRECELSTECENIDFKCYEFCKKQKQEAANLINQQGIIDKIDNMEELDPKIEALKDIRADKKVSQLKANPTATLVPDSQYTSIDSSIFFTPQQKCLDYILCKKCADDNFCQITVDQQCYQDCLDDPLGNEPIVSTFLQKQK